MGLLGGQAGAASGAAASPLYDEQIGMTFTQDLPALAYNVTALAQVDVDGYGPVYLLNGLTAAGYWYQVGVSYHWPNTGGSYNPGFGFSYQVFGPNGKPVFPSGGGAGLGGFSKAVHSGDSVLLSLTFSGSSVQMLAQDWDTGATAKTSYPSMGSSSFVGNPSRLSNSQGFFSGLMTEWYHSMPYLGNQGKVTYTNQAFALTSVWMWIDEFSSANSASPVFTDQTSTPVVFANEQQVYPFASHGATAYSSAHQFITGLLGTVSSRVMLTPAAAESDSPSFAASFTLAGLRQSAEVAAGAGAVVEADPGTSVTISVNSSSSSAFERWVFSGTAGSTVTFGAGSNATYVYYHLVQEIVAYQVVGGGKPLPAGLTPGLTYKEPPAFASSTPGQVTVTQQLGTLPVELFMLLGSDATADVSFPGAAGERWAAGAQAWSVSGPDSIPNPIPFYYQYQVSIGYSIIGGGTPPGLKFTSTSLGNPEAISLSGNATMSWFDAGSIYSFAKILNGSTPGERWFDSGGSAPAPSVISSPGQALSEVYTHQYYATLNVNDPRGGSVSAESGWLEAGSTLRASALANEQWQFETWNGSGAGAYSGSSPAIDVVVTAPLSEEATFFVQLSIAADPRTNIDFSYPSGAGTVQAGSTKTIYVPPSVNVTLRASPSVFLYSFASWNGMELANATRPSLSFVVDGPRAVTGTSSYSYPVLLGGAAAAALVLAGALWVRTRRKRASYGDFAPA